MHWFYGSLVKVEMVIVNSENAWIDAKSSMWHTKQARIQMVLIAISMALCNAHNGK